jgi:hypothetical protein
MALSDARDLAERLGREAEAVCRRYLDAGRRRGRYWQVGDVRNAPGRSMFVRLFDDGPRRAGNWRDAATGEHGDLLDVIAARESLYRFADVIDEARRFLALPREEPTTRTSARAAAPRASPEAARRLFGASRAIAGTLAETYLCARGITELSATSSLRFHPACFHAPDKGRLLERHPAMIAAVTTLNGAIVGVQRTWLAREGGGKAALATPRKAMGELLGHGVRIAQADDVLAAGEGIETVLSVRVALPGMPAVAALSAGALAALVLPPGLRRLYVLRDRDAAGAQATRRLSDRARAAGIEAITLSPRLGDFNDDLRRWGADVLRDALVARLAPGDRSSFAPSPR